MEDHTIRKVEAVALTTAYRNNHEGQTRAFKIDKAEIDEIFAAHPAATGMRVYLGEDFTGLRLVMVATAAEGNDILDTFYDHSVRCPEVCDTSSILNNGI